MRCGTRGPSEFGNAGFCRLQNRFPFLVTMGTPHGPLRDSDGNMQQAYHILAAKFLSPCSENDVRVNFCRYWRACCTKDSHLTLGPKLRWLACLLGCWEAHKFVIEQVWALWS